MSGPLLVHQALHGYQEGHRLLGVSRKLASESLRTLLFLSDRSGPTLHAEFDRYLTGYPLPDDTVYALSMTYDAPEMARPGCVFTHTLLIEWTDLSSVEDLRSLATLFRKPMIGEGFDRYCEPIAQPLISVPSAGWRSSCASALLKAVYADSAPQVLLPADSSREYEELLLAAWSQQWPRLRRAWRFSTGTMSLRGALRKDFDLHVVPRPWARKLSQEAPRALWLDLAGPLPPAEAPWVQFAAADLAQTGRTEMQSFLLEHAADIDQGRTAFPILIDCYLASRDGRAGPPGAWVERLGAQFPQHDEAVRLKQEMLAPLLEPGEGTVREVALLTALAMTKSWRAFDCIDLHAQDRIKRVWAKSRPAALQLTERLHYKCNPLGEQLWRECAHLIHAEEAIAIDKQAPGTLASLLTHNIGLATSEAVWLRPQVRQAELLQQLADTMPQEQTLRRAIYGAVAKYAEDDLTEQACSQLGPDFIRFLLDAIEGEELSTTRKWQGALAARPQVLQEWLSRRTHIQSATGVVLADALEFQLSPELALTVPIWLALLGRDRGPLSMSQQATLCAFVLALGLQDAQGRGSELCQASFATVWNAVQDEHLSERAWHRLAPLLPKRSYLDEVKWRFVHAEKLARALIAAYLRWGWPLSALLATLSEHSVFEGVVDAVHKDKDGGRLLQRLADRVESRQLEATEAQRRLLQRLRWKY